MKKLLAAAALIAATSTVAYAAGGDEIGTPGEKNCKGQTTAWVAQVIKNAELDPSVGRGFAGYADIVGISAQELADAVDAYCAQ